MNLHDNYEDFDVLCSMTAQKLNLPVEAIRKDYFIIYVLKKLSESEYVNYVIFKGGTSLSKCYPNSIERFSEDIDLTLVPKQNESDNSISKKLIQIELKLTEGGTIEKINEERSNRNKSCFVWFDNKIGEGDKIKLEIGSSVKPDPFSKRSLKSYIHEYLIGENKDEIINEFELKEIELNVLNIERTFIDKLMAIKRHAICGSLNGKVRHIYDVVKLYKMREIQSFLHNRKELKSIVIITKETDLEYLEKRNILKEYNPNEQYNFDEWKYLFNDDIKKNYERLHEKLLYSNEPENWEEVETTFLAVNKILKEIEE